MRPETKEFIIREFGEGVHQSNAPKAEDRYTAGFDKIATSMQAACEGLLDAPHINPVARDTLVEVLLRMEPHDWKMAAIHLFNAKETA